MARTVDLDRLLARRLSLETRASQTRDFPGRLRELRAWQAARLARTYDDLRRDRHCSRAIDFFLSDLYGPLDAGPRDRQLMRALRVLRRTLPAAARTTFERALELDVLSAELDHAMVALMRGWPVGGGEYATVYRRVGRRDERERQIDLVVAIGTDLDRIVRRDWIATVLHLWHAPARISGFGALHDFLERGFESFRSIRDAGAFLQTIREREVELMERLFAGGGEEVFELAADRRRF
jgi:hypothetical protein